MVIVYLNPSEYHGTETIKANSFEEALQSYRELLEKNGYPTGDKLLAFPKSAIISQQGKATDKTE